jgi:O-antigen ligase
VTGVRHVLLAAFVFGLVSSISLSETALALLTALWLLRLRDPSLRRQMTWPLWAPVLAFSGASVVSALLSGSAASSLWASRDLLLVLALYVIADAVGGPDGANKFLIGLAFACAPVALAGLVQVLACPSPEPVEGLAAWFFRRCDRARGYFSIYMTLAGVLTMVLLATLPRLLPGRSASWWLVPPWVVILAGLAATYVRGAWLGFGAGVLACIPTRRRGRMVLVAGLLLLVVGTLLGPESLSRRLRSVVDPHDATIKERIYMWRSGLAMWSETPWFGVGPGVVKHLYPDFALPEARKKRTSHVHNTPLQIMVERGLVGLGAWLWIWAAFFAQARTLLRALPAERSRERALIAGSLAAVTGFLVHGLSEYNFGDAEVVLVAWTLMALPFAAARRANP